jgi:hypothetical protein
MAAGGGAASLACGFPARAPAEKRLPGGARPITATTNEYDPRESCAGRAGSITHAAESAGVARRYFQILKARLEKRRKEP